MRWFSIYLVGLLVFLPSAASSLECVNGKKSSYWVWSSFIPESARFAKNIYAYQGVFNIIAEREVYRFEGLSPHSIDGYSGSLTLTYRLETLVHPEMVISRFKAHRKAWIRHGILVDGIQIDYDSPTAKLHEYADWVILLKQVIGKDTCISITGLGDWLASAPPNHLNDLFHKVSFIAFMMYHGSQPLKHIDTYITLLSRLSLPFKLGRLQTQVNAKEFENVFQAPGYQGEIIFVDSGGN